MQNISFNKIKNHSKAECIVHKKALIQNYIIIAANIILLLIAIISRPEILDLERITSKSFMKIANELSYALHYVYAISGFFFVFVFSSELYNRRITDIKLSLPLNSAERYFSKILSIFKHHILPVVCTYTLLVIISIMLKKDGDNISEMLSVMLKSLSDFLFTDALALFAVCCCETKISAFMLLCAVGGSFVFTPFLFLDIIFNCFCININLSKIPDFMHFFNFSNLGNFNHIVLTNTSVLYKSLSILFSLLIMFLSYCIYKRRNGRTYDRVIIFKPINIFVIFISLFTSFTFFNVAAVNFITGLSWTFIFYIVLKIILNRKKYKDSIKCFLIYLLKWIGTFAAALCVFVCILYLSYTTKGFGLEKSILKSQLKNSDIAFSIKNQQDTTYNELEKDVENKDELINLIIKYSENKKNYSNFNDFLHIHQNSYFNYDNEYTSFSIYEKNSKSYNKRYINFSVTNEESEKLLHDLYEKSLITLSDYEEYHTDKYYKSANTPEEAEKLLHELYEKYID